MARYQRRETGGVDSKRRGRVYVVDAINDIEISVDEIKRLAIQGLDQAKLSHLITFQLKYYPDLDNSLIGILTFCGSRDTIQATSFVNNLVSALERKGYQRDGNYPVVYNFEQQLVITVRKQSAKQ